MAKRKLSKTEKIQAEIIFKKNLQELRLKQNPPISMAATAKRLALSPPYYHALEDEDRHTNPSFKTMEKIARYYHIQVWELFI